MYHRLVGIYQSILGKLFLMGLLILLSVGGIVSVNLFSFQEVETLVTTTIDTKMRQVIENARLGRKLNTAFADTNLLIYRFSEQPELLETRGTSLLAGLADQVNGESALENEQLQTALNEYTSTIKNLLDHASHIVNIQRMLNSIHNDMIQRLTTLDDMISEKMLMLAMEAASEEQFALDQLLTMTPEYRYTLAEASLLLNELLKASIGTDKIDEDLFRQFIHLFDDFFVSLTAVKLAGDEFVSIGEQFSALAHQYQRQVNTLFEELQVFHTQFIEMKQAQEQVMTVMARIDTDVSQAANVIHQELAEEIHASQMFTLFLSVGVLFILLIAGFFVLKMIRPLTLLAQTANQLARGDISPPLYNIHTQDEVGVLAAAFREMISYIHQIAATTESISEGNLQVEVLPRSSEDVLNRSLQKLVVYIHNVADVTEKISKKDLHVTVTPKSEQDILNTSLQQMVVNLHTMMKDIEQQSWLKDGINQLNMTLSGEVSLREACDRATAFAARYVHAGRGVLYTFDAERSLLNLQGTYAFTEHDQLAQQWKMGEGIIGQVAQEYSPILLKHLSAKESIIHTGTIQEPPLQTYTMPLIYNEMLYGVLELASFEEFDKGKQEFLLQAALVVATAIFSALQRERGHILIQQAQKAVRESEQAKQEMQQQTEEARRANVLLEEQQQQLQQQNEEFQQLNAQLNEQQQRIHQEIQGRIRTEEKILEERHLIQQVIDLLPDYVYAKDQESRFILANQTLVVEAGFASVEELLGKTDFDIHPQNLAEQFYANEQQMMQSGQTIWEHEECVENKKRGEKVWLRTTKIPFQDRQGQLAGFIGIGRNITELKQAQEQLLQLSEELKCQTK